MYKIIGRMILFLLIPIITAILVIANVIGRPLMVVCIGMILVIFSLSASLCREKILNKFEIESVILEQTFVKQLLILELAGIFIIILGVLKYLGLFSLLISS